MRTSLDLARARGFRSIAMPLIGAGTGGGRAERIEAWIEEEAERHEFEGQVRIVRYRP